MRRRWLRVIRWYVWRLLWRRQTTVIRGGWPSFSTIFCSRCLSRRPIRYRTSRRDRTRSNTIRRTWYRPTLSTNQPNILSRMPEETRNDSPLLLFSEHADELHQLILSLRHSIKLHLQARDTLQELTLSGGHIRLGDGRRPIDVHIRVLVVTGGGRRTHKTTISTSRGWECVTEGRVGCK